MARVLTIGESEYALPEEKEWYKATLIDVEDGPQGKYGPTIKWVFELHVDDDEELDGLKVNRLTPAEPTVRNACGRMIQWLTGISEEEMLGYEFDIDAILEDGGIDCYVMCKHKTSPQGGKFANVDDVKLPTRKKKAGKKSGGKKAGKKGTEKSKRKAAPPPLEPDEDEDDTPPIDYDEDSESDIPF